LSAENIGVGSAIASGIWGVLSSVAHLPPGVIGVGAGTVGLVGIGQAIKAKMESRWARRKKHEGDNE
jgi:hypothetical protein